MTWEQEVNEKIDAYFLNISDEQLIRDFDEVSYGDTYTAPDIVLTEEFYQDLERSRAIQIAMREISFYTDSPTYRFANATEFQNHLTDKQFPATGTFSFQFDMLKQQHSDEKQLLSSTIKLAA